jgi:hypothetical protein
MNLQLDLGAWVAQSSEHVPFTCDIVDLIPIVDVMISM